MYYATVFTTVKNKGQLAQAVPLLGNIMSGTMLSAILLLITSQRVLAT
ncbi:MAG: hypothetical protein ACI9C4_003314 [Paraglaciecola sp.]